MDCKVVSCGMDSGNSGSLQSSSGGDDDFDAACGGGADSSSSSPLAALLRHQGFGGGASALIYGLQDLGAPPLSSHWCSTTATAPLPLPAGAGSSPPSSLPCHGGLAASGEADQAAPATAAQPSPPAAPPRGSRKRARASRRAPTTVLTTDTSNFRAMVQEFTGIPAPPFAAGAARSRLDHLFPSRSTAAAALPQYLLRPFAHKLPAYPPPSTSSPAPATAAALAGASTEAMASGEGYQHQLATAVPSALLGMQDHGGGGYLSFQFQRALAGQLDGGGDAGKYPLFERGVAPPSVPRPLPDPADFLGVAHGVVSSEGHLHQRNGDRGHGGDELLSGLVGGCKATYSTTAPPLLGLSGRGPPAGASTGTTTAPPVAPATAAIRTQGVESWVCSTSE